jgi:NAD(P)-dependent dehydrogenase (short-subunit alcohol dehydrogenase family)
MTNYNPFSLERKTILVTGASSGIGKAIAIECSKIGAKVVISGRNEERLNETFNQLGGEGHLKVCAELSSEEELDKLVDFTPVLTGLVNCAGLGEYIPFHFINKEKLDKTFDTNFYATALLTQKLLQKKKIANSGSIVFISSISGIYCSAYGASIYSASKGAINGLVKGMALDLSVKQIRVNSINPGVIDTNIFENGTITEEQLKEDIQKYPLKRHGKPEEVAYAVIYLLSDASQWVTGSNLVIDGGYTLL